MDLKTVKTLARLTGDQDDAYITALLPLIKTAVRQYTGKKYIDDQGEDAFSPMAQLAIVKWVQMYANPAGVASQSMSGGISFSYDLGSQGIPPAVQELLAGEIEATAGPGKRFSFVPMPKRSPAIGVPDLPYRAAGGEWIDD